MEILKLNGIGSFLNYEYKVKFNENDKPEEIERRIEKIFKDDQKVKLRYPENSASGIKRIINNFSQFLSCTFTNSLILIFRVFDKLSLIRIVLGSFCILS